MTPRYVLRNLSAPRIHRISHAFAHFIFTMISLCACRTVGPTASSLKWGYLADDSHHLINLPNNSTIGVCGADVEIIGWAINSWGAAIGRHYSVVADCDHEKIDNWPPNSDFAKSNCAQFNITTAYARPELDPQQIVDCGEMDGAVGYIHEVGHLFGLCDQYADHVGNCAYNNGIVAGSIMNASDKEYLTQDDLDGIRALAKKNNINVSTDNSGSNASNTIDLVGAGVQSGAFSPAATGSGVAVTFASGCEGPWTGQIVVNGLNFECDNCAGPQGDTGPWLFSFGANLNVTSVKANLGDGSCVYHVHVYP